MLSLLIGHLSLIFDLSSLVIDQSCLVLIPRYPLMAQFLLKSTKEKSPYIHGRVGEWVGARIVSSFSDHRSCPGLVQLITMQNIQCETSACRCSSSKVSAATVSMMQARRATAMSAFTLLQCLGLLVMSSSFLEGHGYVIV